MASYRKKTLSAARMLVLVATRKMVDRETPSHDARRA